MQYAVASVLRAKRREKGFDEGVRQGRIVGVAMGRAVAWNEVRVDVVDEGDNEGSVEDVREGAARERKVRERDEIMAATNKRHCRQ